MPIAEAVRLEWRDFPDLPAALLYDLLRFRQAIFVVEQRSIYADLDGLDPRAHHLLLWTAGSLAGCLRLIPHAAERRVAIGRVAVGPEERGRGHARRLTAAALRRCRADYPGWRVTLSAQEYLAGFYAGLGFAPVSAPYDDAGIPHIDMVLCG